MQIRLDGHPTKHPRTVDTWLVVSRYQNNSRCKAGFFYFFCDFPGTELSPQQIITKVLSLYQLRWKIEEVHKHIKQEYGWEKMQLMSYTGLKNMNQCLFLAMCYLYSLRACVEMLLKAFPEIMQYSEKRWKDIYRFVYNCLSKVVEHCFSFTRRYNILEYGGVWAKSQQSIIPCLKNGGM